MVGLGLRWFGVGRGLGLWEEEGVVGGIFVGVLV